MKRTLFAIALLAATTPAAAQDTGSEGWQFALSPYLWTAGISGRASVLAAIPPVQVSQSFSDIFQNLDLAGMVQLQARKGRFALTGDVAYIRTTAREETPGPLIDEIRLRSTSKSAALMGEVLLYEDATNLLWAGAGIRYWDVSNNVRITSSRDPVLEGGASDSWFDPVLGVRANVGLAGPVFAMGWAYVGGFGIGSDFTADLYGGLGYRFSRSFSAQLGYRWLAVDRTNGDFGYNVEQRGPQLGVTLRF
jgi:hypothetical protein